MFLLNLSFAELLGLFGLVSAATVALYLLSRARQRHRVATLKFWQSALPDAQSRRRRRIDQPFSLLLQLLGLLLLLLAAAQPRWGSRESRVRDHVLLLDASAWMPARAGSETLDSASRRQSLEWLRRLPPQDRVMVVEAGPVATPLTRFETDRARLRQAITNQKPGAGALDLPAAFDFARQAQRMQGGRPGEIVYSGPSRIATSGVPDAGAVPSNLRMLPLQAFPENCGFTRVTLRPGAAPGEWQVFAAVRNYGRRPRTLPLAIAFGQAAVGSQTLRLEPGAERVAEFRFKTRAAGILEARLLQSDDLASDDRALLEIPAQRPVKVTVYSETPDLFRPLLAADPRVEATYLAPRAYRADAEADLVIFDHFAPPALPRVASLWIEPPAQGSPVAIRADFADAEITGWRGDHPLGAGLRSRGASLKGVHALTPVAGDLVLADSNRGPLAVVRETGGRKLAVLGFHPLTSEFRFELATPLLFANVLSWAAPDAFRIREVQAAGVGAVTANVSASASSADVRVISDTGQALPFTLDKGSLRFFTATPSTVRVLSGGAEQVFSLTLPQVAETRWDAPPAVKVGLPPALAGPALARDWWPWLAALGAALLLYEWWRYGRDRSPLPKLGWALKGLVAACVLASFFEPAISINETKMAVGVLADTSASASAADLERASSFAASVQRAAGRHWTRVIPFARTTRPLQPAEYAAALRLQATAGAPGRATDLETAVREGMAALPEGLAPRLVLVSDGRENRGSVARAAWLARQAGLPIDTVPLAGRPEPKLRLTSVRLPGVAFTGEKFPLEMTVESPRAGPATVELRAEGKTLGRSEVTLEAGVNLVRVNAALAVTGAIEIAGVLAARDLGEVRFEQALALRRPRLLYLTMDVAGMESHFIQALAAAQYDIVTGSALGHANLDDYQLLVLNNYDFESIPRVRKLEIETWVKQGGGLLAIGGERNLWIDKKGKEEDPLDRTMPATVAPPRSPEGTVLVIILDKSSSMEGRKMELARLAAIGVIDNLRSIDMVGVLIFDNSHQWAVPIRRAEDRTMIKRLVAGVTPDGGTQIAPALAEAYNRIQRSTGMYRHIVLLTDGISEEGDSMSVAKDAAEKKVTISTVGLGQDVNRSFLEKVALLAKGRSHFLTDPSGLEQILLKDVREHTGQTTVEKTLQARVLRKTEILEGIDIEKAPALKGYVRYDAKPGAEKVLEIDEKEPLLARWQYGLGRAAVFTSDAKGRWAEAWVTWSGFDRFWANLGRDLLPHAQPGAATAGYDAASGDLVVEYRVTRAAPESAPPLFVFGPGDFRAPLPVTKAADGLWRGRIRIGDRQGLFRVRPVTESRAFPEIGFYRPEEELSTWGSNEALLKQVAEYTGGRFNPSPQQVFDAAGRAIPGALRLWPLLLGLAVLIDLVELLVRKTNLLGRLAPAR